ncbi:TetR/AcrR family transcriptional regulator [Nitratireductor sp. B36]|uniref:TetR/AcrR family transcriptional regulator n=1 Tax=Nitratireductor sp. B36 TaxID=2762059 RepID=UPI001E388442|nr:TetR/AcrR family transcriptional regulator [Nitratireductor sp. B36]MCC5779779.1 TetR/AcrR family transcriptional regulator [Nitratireductor sp. B36]
MPRPKTVSDEEVLGAALDVLVSRGMVFTLSDIARHVGLSRATLIQRFGDRDSILRKIAEQELEATRSWLDGLSVVEGPDALWQFLETIVCSMGKGDGFFARVQIAAFESRDPSLRSLAHQRYALVQEAIAARLPNSAEPLEIAKHLHAIIAGATMQWVVTDGAQGLSEFVLRRLWWAVDNLRQQDLT